MSSDKYALFKIMEREMTDREEGEEVGGKVHRRIGHNFVLLMKEQYKET